MWRALRTCNRTTTTATHSAEVFPYTRAFAALSVGGHAAQRLLPREAPHAIWNRRRRVCCGVRRCCGRGGRAGRHLKWRDAQHDHVCATAQRQASTQAYVISTNLKLELYAPWGCTSAV